MIVLGGGLDRMNHWKDKGRRFFLPVKVMSAVFKKHYLAELKELRENGDLNYAGKCEPLGNGHAFKELLDRLYGMDWIAYSKKTFAGAREVFKYLGKYTQRIIAPTANTNPLPCPVRPFFQGSFCTCCLPDS